MTQSLRTQTPAGGRRLVKADTFEDRILISGTNCSNCGSQWTAFAFPSAGGLAGYVVQPGDKLCLRQFQWNGARGGMDVAFTDGTSTEWAASDQFGQTLNDLTYPGWIYRRADLSSFAGKTISNIYLIADVNTPAVAWSIYYNDIALISTDGTVHPIYTRQKTVSLAVSGTSGVTGVGYAVSHDPGVLGASNFSDNMTNYYHGDHLGSQRLMTSVDGYPVWSATYLPFGQEWNPQTTVNHYKFTGKERDSESGLDHFQFRKFSSAMGRFMSPDPAGMMAVDIGSPPTLNRYAYVLNNPLSFTDPFGLDCAYLNSSGTGIEKGGIDQNSSSGECGKTGGYWVEGTVTQVNIDPNATTISLIGTTNGTNTTTASYQQDAVVTVGEYNNTSLNPYHHVALGLLGQPQFGQNPRSDARFLYELSRHGPTATVPGQIKQQKGGQLLRTARIRATGMQSQMLQNAMNQSAQNPPPYTLFGTTGCDCGTWVQMMLGDAGINAGPPTPMPDVLMDQLNQIYPQQQQPPQQ